MKHLAKLIFTHFMTIVNFQNFSLFCSLFRLLAGSFYQINGNLKGTTADLIMSTLGGVCDMLPHYCEWIAVLFYIRSGYNHFTQWGTEPV